jgi:hypothetical protein
MTRANDQRNIAQTRTRIAGAAARLIAEHGIGDYALAKRKAAHSLGLPDGTPLPENAEVENELRTYQRLFQDGEQSARIDHLRQKACELMAIMCRFNAYLTGSVLDGSAGRYAEIDIQLFTDSAKDVEIFMLNQRLDFTHSVPRSERAEAVLTLNDADAVINLIIYPARDERVAFKTRDGRIRQHARRDAVLKLINATRPESP